MSSCKTCHNKKTLIRQRKLKEEAVSYKGGVCTSCGGSFHPAIFDFHHTNPEEKDFSFAQQKCTKMNEKLKKELDKCVLLCANCHRLAHVKY